MPITAPLPRWLPALLRRLRGGPSGALAAIRGPDGPPLPRPTAPICAVGDIHGRADLLDAMVERVTAEIAAAGPAAAGARVVVLGDMVDRGPDSATVLDRLHGLACRAPARWTCLMGNHERMMLDFAAVPDAQARWLRFGGDRTLTSFGVTVPDPADPDALEQAGAALRAALARRPGLTAWLDGLPALWRDGPAGRIAAVHAGADPRRPLERQDPAALIWGHPDFARRPRRDGTWVVHGHVVVPEPTVARGRINVDTGAWRSGRLSAAWLDASGLRFLEARADGR